MNMKVSRITNPDKDYYSRLVKSSDRISTIFSSLQTETLDKSICAKLKEAQTKFNCITAEYQSLSSGLRQDLTHLADKARTVTAKAKTFRRRSEKKLMKQEKIIEIKESQIQSTARTLNKSLGCIKRMWTSNLRCMKKSLKKQRILKDEITGNYIKLDKEVAEELTDALGVSYSEKHGKTIDKELISHESAFCGGDENNEAKSALGMHLIRSENQSNVSIEFEKCMAEIDNQRSQHEYQNVSIEKSFGGWKSEYESDGESFVAPVNPNEIKSAINILRKANLLNSKGGNILEKLSMLLKSSGNTQKIELMLQLYNLQNKSRPSSTRGLKPPIQISKLKKLPEDLAATPKAAFVFPDDLELNKTILSSENPLSARQRDESLDGILEELSKSSQDLKDVQLEDLLKIPYFVQDLKLQSAEIIENPHEAQNTEDQHKNYLSSLGVMSPSEAKLPSPVKKQTNPGFDCQSTGISSQSGLRSRIALKTGGSENSQKVFTPGSKGVGETFKYL